jgi:tetratricopeptide (TPR) repeat protein
MVGNFSRNFILKTVNSLFLQASLICWILIALLAGTMPPKNAYAQKPEQEPHRQVALRHLRDVSPGKLTEQQVIRLAEAFVAEGKVQKAIELLTARFRASPTSRRIGEKLAELYVEQDQSAKAIEVYKVLLRTYRNDRRYWLRLGQLFLWNDRQREAIIAYEQAVKLDSTDLQALQQLSQLYNWTDQQEKAYRLQAKMLELDPSNAALWKQHGIQARWIGKNQDAIYAFQQALLRKPGDEELLFLIGETYVWEDNPAKAEPYLREVLRRNPKHVKARFYLAQIRHWQPYGWWEARKLYRSILAQDPTNPEVRKYLDLIRQDYGPLLFTRVFYIQDSNNLIKTEARAQHSQYISARVQWSLHALFNRLAETKPSGRFAVFGSGLQVGGRWQPFDHTYFQILAGAINYQQNGAFFIGSFRWEQALFEGRKLGDLYSTLALRREPLTDGVLGIKEGTQTTRLSVSLYWEGPARFRMSTDVTYGWYTDNNEKFQLYNLAEWQFYTGRPSLFLELLYALEDTKLNFPDADPYWTPQNFWTRSAGIRLDYLIKTFSFVGGFALTQQPGNEVATNWKLGFRWKPNPFTHLEALARNYGSQYYSYQAVEARFSYRW